VGASCIELGVQVGLWIQIDYRKHRIRSIVNACMECDSALICVLN